MGITSSRTYHRHRNVIVAVLSHAGFLISLVFAAAIPVDHLLANGSSLLSTLLFVGGTWVGTSLAPKVGLLTGAKVQKSYLSVTLAPALATALFVILIDAVCFRSSLPSKYVDEFLTAPVSVRLPAYCARAFYESLMYRLFIGTVLTWCISRSLGQRDAAPFRVVLVAMFVAQMINITANVLVPYWTEVTPTLILWMVLRFVLPGTLWGCLYYRNGLIVSEYVAAITHIFLQPLIGPALAATM